ncbi:MFS transporter [Bailinhaonella thermotolerans]|uniref:MFS transporter n=1 Tax=Bailinhaonella thermotolerans TaxID=1070861 RepID=A0A3A4AU75_9ACTN|nr:MFS transporter [Bailinhaonella thermotolerans]RJL33540.1 MFS transporter [Bailinhaonella thermotolerans]
MVAPRTPRVLGLRLADGIGKGNMWALLTLAFFSTLAITFLPATQAYILTTVLGVPREQHGTIVGSLGVAAEIAMLVSLLWYGALADRIGRRPIVLAGFTLLALGALLFPWAGNTWVLHALRVVFAFGVAALNTMLSTIAVDYVRDRWRGRSYGITGLFGGVGAIVATMVVVKLPRMFEAQGMEPVTAARVAFAIVGVGIALVGVILWFSLSPKRISETAARTPLTSLIAAGVRQGRDPGVALAYAASFVARADLAVVAGFLSLWVINHGTHAGGLSGAEALARAGAVVGIAYSMGLIASPVFGWLGDRMKRQNVVILAQLVSAGAYLSTLFISDPLGSGMFVVAVLVGIGEIAAITTIGPLLAQQVPADVRGTAYGVQTLCGAAGILIVSGLGGWLYDVWRPAAPFILVGLMGLAVACFGLVVRRRVVPSPLPPAEDEAAAVRA